MCSEWRQTNSRIAASLLLDVSMVQRRSLLQGVQSLVEMSALQGRYEYSSGKRNCLTLISIKERMRALPLMYADHCVVLASGMPSDL